MINIIDTKIKDVKIIEPQVYKDERGYFFESYNEKEFHNKIGKINFIQDNESFSKFGTLRGLHFQKNPYEQSKLVRVIKGEIQDVVVDIRIESLTYLKYLSIKLSEKNKKQIFIPKGFAHGFLVLSDEAIVSYKVDNYFNPESCSGIKFNDPDISIGWKLNTTDIILSENDKILPLIKK